MKRTNIEERLLAMYRQGRFDAEMEIAEDLKRICNGAKTEHGLAIQLAKYIKSLSLLNKK